MLLVIALPAGNASARFSLVSIRGVCCNLTLLGIVPLVKQIARQIDQFL